MGAVIGMALAASLTVLRFTPPLSHDFRSRVHVSATPFSNAVVSWNVYTPGAGWIETHLRARVGRRWTRWFDMGEWSAQQAHRHSLPSQPDSDGRVETDTLLLEHAASAWQVGVVVHAAPGGPAPLLRLVAVTLGGDAMQLGDGATGPSGAWGTDLDVPELTQRVDESPDAMGGGGDAWCSPTSVAMVMAYWARRTRHPQWEVGVPQAAAGTYDTTYKGCGNWPFSVAFASEHGLAGWVQRLDGLHRMEGYVRAGIPLVASIRVRPGELLGSPYVKTDGHLLVVRGFTSRGDVIVNDPYALPGKIRIVYRKDQFQRVWMNGSGGIVYVIAPAGDLEDVR